MLALLLIDLQNDFMPGGSLAVPFGLEAVKAANFAQQFFSAVIATKDWHPEQHLSFANNHDDKVPGDHVMLDGHPQILWPVHCVQHTFGAALVNELDQRKIEHVVTKGENLVLDSYSAFFDSGTHETGLAHYLDQRGIDEVYLMGVATEYCVKASALDAIKVGLKTHVIVDGCRGVGLREKDIPDAVSEMRDAGVRLTDLASIARGF